MDNKYDDYRLKYIEEKLYGHDDRIKGLEKMTNEFTKISTILEMQTKMNEKQDETLGKINDNLTHLNHTTKVLGDRVNDLETEVKEVNKRDTVSVTGFLRKFGWTVLVGIVGGAIGWYFKGGGTGQGK